MRSSGISINLAATTAKLISVKMRRRTSRKFMSSCRRRRCQLALIVTGAIFWAATKNMFHVQYSEKGLKRLSGQSLIDYLGTYLQVNYSPTDVVLTNSGPLDIPPGVHWTIYFSHLGGLHADAQMSLQHVDGFLHRVTTIINNATSRSFHGLRSLHNLTLFTGVRLKSLSYAFPRWYVVGDSNTQPRIIVNTDTDDMDFVKSFDDGGKYDVSLASRRHGFNRDSAPPANSSPKPIIPTPLKIDLDTESATSKEIHIDSSWTVVYDGHQLRNEAIFISKKLTLESAEAKPKDSSRSRVIQLHVKSTLNVGQLTVSESEGYVLEVAAAHQRVVVSGVTTAGVFYGLQSLLSLLAASDDGRTLSTVRVVDAPRVPYRGVMLDVARNFLDKHYIFRLLDVISMYKLNVLHLHLSDDQGWRLEVPALPELTDIGSRRRHDPNQTSSLLPYLGSGPYDAVSRQYYSVSDYRDILRRATELHVQVIPEIDMPGHMHAAIQSMRVRTAKLNSQGSSGAGLEYQLSDPDDRSFYFGVNKQRDTVVNPCLNSTYRFVELIIQHLISLHKDIQPMQVLHLGGDEVPLHAVKQSPVCRHHNLDVGPRLYFMRLAVDVAARLGVKTVQVWQDGVTNMTRHPVGLSEWNTGIKMVVNAWVGKKHRVFDFANVGYQAIMTHANHLYLDHPYERDHNEPGLVWATSHIGTRQVFDYHLPPPSNGSDAGLLSAQMIQRLCRIYDEAGCPNLHRPDNIVGVEACLWGEMLRSPERADYMLYPRLLAVAERAWHRASWESIVDSNALTEAHHKDWAQFTAALGHRELRRLDQLGVHYRLPRPGLLYNSGQFGVNVEFPGLSVEYSVDNGQTWSKIPSSSFTAKKSTTYLFITRSPDGRRVSRPVRIRTNND